jgi:hypothetical protein
MKKKLTKAIGASDTIIDKFSGILFSIRTQMKHKGVKVPKKGTAQYSLMATVAKDAQDFCKEFELELEDGMKIFCTLGVEFMKSNYGLNKFSYYLEKIYRRYEVLCKLDGSDTKDLVKHWEYLVIEYTGIELEVGNDPEKLIHFVYMWDQLVELKYDDIYEHWLNAQFDQIHSLHSDIPEFSQLHGEEAKRRYDRYVAKRAAESKASGDTFESDEEEEYTKLIRK